MTHPSDDPGILLEYLARELFDSMDFQAFDSAQSPKMMPVFDPMRISFRAQL